MKGLTEKKGKKGRSRNRGGRRLRQGETTGAKDSKWCGEQLEGEQGRRKQWGEES